MTGVVVVVEGVIVVVTFVVVVALLSMSGKYCMSFGTRRGIPRTTQNSGSKEIQRE